MKSPKRKFPLVTTAQVENQAFFRRMQMVYRNLPFSERDTIDEIANELRDMDGEGITLVKPQELVPYPLMDTIWNGNTRYVRQFVQLDHCIYPERDKYLALLIQRRWPQVYRHLLR